MKVLAISCALALVLPMAAAANAVVTAGPAQPVTAPPSRMTMQPAVQHATGPLHATDPAPEPARRADPRGPAAAASAPRAGAGDDFSREPRTGLLLLAGLAALLFMAARHSS